MLCYWAEDCYASSSDATLHSPPAAGTWGRTKLVTRQKYDSWCKRVLCPVIVVAEETGDQATNGPL